MKIFFVVGALAFAFVSGQASAACAESGGWKKMNVAGSGGSLALSTLGGKTVCVGSSPTWEAQEFHQGTSGAANNLIDFKRGPGHATDPTGPVGSWSIEGNQIRHNYGAGANYIYDVYEKSGAYSFCVGSSEKAAATVRTGQVGC